MKPQQSPHVTSGLEEYDAGATPSPTLRQGDVIQFFEEQEDGARLGVVVTANCDIANDKTGGFINYVPVVDLSRYISHHMAPAIVAKLGESAAKKLHGCRENGDPAPSLETLHTIFNESLSAERSTEHLQSTSSYSPSVMTLIGDYMHSLQASNELKACEDFGTAVRVLEGMPQIVRDRKGARSRTSDDIQTRLLEMPGDSYFLHSPALGMNQGYVALLRFIRVMALETVSVSYSDRTESHSAARISNLKPIFTHSLVQTMAAVFTPIGIPNEFVLQRPTHLHRLLKPLESTT
jgi:hypothetical protein